MRVKKCVPDCTSPTRTTVYIFSGTTLLAEYDNGAAVVSASREYIHTRSAVLAKIESGNATYYHSDHLSLRATTDGSGDVIAQQGHYPFGDSLLWYLTGPQNKMTFTTYERDAESSNDYAVFRSHINRFGRFSSPDPLGGSVFNPQSLNRYSYALNDPCNLLDPLGLETCAFRISVENTSLSVKSQSTALRQIYDIFKGQTDGEGNGVAVVFTNDETADFRLYLENGALDDDPGYTDYCIFTGCFGSPTVNTNVVEANTSGFFGPGVKRDSIDRTIGSFAAHEIVHKILGGQREHVPGAGTNLMNPDISIDGHKRPDQTSAFNLSERQVGRLFEQCKKKHPTSVGGSGTSSGGYYVGTFHTHTHGFGVEAIVHVSVTWNWVPLTIWWIPKL